MKKIGIILAVLAVLLMAVIGGGLFAGYKITNSETIMKNVTVGGIELGGLNRSQADEKLIESGWQARMETPLSVTLPGGRSFTVDPVKAGFVMPAEDAVDAAYIYGHDRNMVENLITYLKLMGEQVDINSLYALIDEDYINGCIDNGFADLTEYMGTDEYTADLKAGELKLKKGWNQLSFDRKDLFNEIVRALSEGRTELEYTKLARELTAPDFDAIADRLRSEPKDAFYSDDGFFTVTDEVVGCDMDAAGAKSIWDKAKAGDEVVIPLKVTFPETTGDYLRSRLYCDLLGACTTKFPASGEARRENLRLALDKINGYILYAGDEFSYNDVVGERTEEAGFRPAPAYVNGDTKDEIGGGVCQVASTLYASTVFAFLETVDRTCHYFPPSYMQMGTDATVTIPKEGKAINFRFRNNKEYPIKIVTYFDNENSNMTVEIWGTLMDYDYMPVEFNNTYGWEFDYDRFIDPAYTDREGVSIQLSHETYMFEDDVGPGYRTLTHRVVTDSEGTVLEDTIINPETKNGHAMDTYYIHQQ